MGLGDFTGRVNELSFISEIATRSSNFAFTAVCLKPPQRSAHRHATCNARGLVRTNSSKRKTTSDYVASWYYTVRIDELSASRYHVACKVALRICIRSSSIGSEVIYPSRGLEKPKTIGAPVLCDFGSAAWGEEQNEFFVQPDVYRSPEVILKSPWSYSNYAWNVACMIWDIFEGGDLFCGTDPEQNAYRNRAHLAEIIAPLGPPPSESKSFSDAMLQPISTGQLETNPKGEDKEPFLQFMGKMLLWDPRMEPKELLNDVWLKKHL
ncbi:hypothetical protein BDN71DRAFT_1507390 [Pleurotus eryngii]|uniref:Protein kinase domain-containing protein n=1 Tax=Pleurotus eryngii TaxID=5323 RepID=A0A9P5ZUH9_PLEER|nr:hypothetical protein BDN71DRAFT_1507390 [Pleurotus eryngii]